MLWLGGCSNQDPTFEVLWISLPLSLQEIPRFYIPTCYRCSYSSFHTARKICPYKFLPGFVNIYWLFFDNQKIICHFKIANQKVCPKLLCAPDEIPDQLWTICLGMIMKPVNSWILSCDTEISQHSPCIHNHRNSLGQNFLRWWINWKVTVTNDAEHWDRLPVELIEITHKHTKKI